MEHPYRLGYSEMTPRLRYDTASPRSDSDTPRYNARARFDSSTSRARSRDYTDYPRDTAYRERAYSDPQYSPNSPRSPTTPREKRALSDARPYASNYTSQPTRPPNGIERFVRADDPAAQNPLRRLVGRVCGVTPQRATELYLRREEESDRVSELPAYGSSNTGVIMPAGMGLDLDFDIESEGTRLAQNLDRGRLGRSDHLHAARA